jgi:hypothetical protein
MVMGGDNGNNNKGEVDGNSGGDDNNDNNEDVDGDCNNDGMTTM